MISSFLIGRVEAEDPCAPRISAIGFETVRAWRMASGDAVDDLARLILYRASPPLAGLRARQPASHFRPLHQLNLRHNRQQ